MIGQHGTEHQGSQLGTQADGFKTEAADHQGQQQAEQYQQFVVAAGIQQPIE